MLSATSNITGLNFKLTDLCEASVYDKEDKYEPKSKRVEVISTIHLAQTPGLVDEEVGKELDWKPTETART
jgi:hypothetical protein